MDAFRDSMATSIALARNWCKNFYYYEHVIKEYLGGHWIYNISVL